MNAHKIVPGLLMAAGLTLPVAATVEFLSHVDTTSLTVAPKPTTHSGTGKPAPPTPSGTGGGHPKTPSATSGTFTGIAAQGYFGPVQATLTVKGGKITGVGITAPQDNPTSAYINSVAVPMLQKETLKAQSANINGVSGATVTSEFYYQSLVSALKQAHLQ